MARRLIHYPRILLFGDSITASYAYGTSPGAAGPGWYNNANAQSVQALGVPLNSGVGSDTLTDMLARFASDVTAFPTPYVHVLGGVNDLHNGRDGALCVTDIETICDDLLAGGRTVLLGTMYPTSTSEGSASITTELVEMNTGVRSYAAGEANVHLVDYSDAMSSDGETIDDSGYRIDAVHPSKAGSAVMAQTLAPVLVSVA